MNYQEFVNITVDECIKFADYLGYLPPEEFGEEEIIDSLEISNNQKAKEALKFYKNLSVTKADVLLEKVFNKLENGVEERTSTYVNCLLTKDQQASWAKCLTATYNSTGVNFRSSYGIVLTYSFL